MKCHVPAAQLKKALKAVTSIYNYAKDDAAAKSVGILSVEDDGLWIEYGSSGAYLRKRIDATVLREGLVGIDLKLLQKCRITTGDVTLTYSEKDKSLGVKTGKQDLYTLKTEQGTKTVIAAFRPDPISKKQQPHVEIPPHLLRLASGSVMYKPGEENKKLTVQASFKKLKKKKSQFSLSARDNYSFANYITTLSDGLKVNKNFKFILASNLLQEIMKEAGGEDTIQIWDIVGGDEETSVVRFISKDLDFCHPVMGEESFANMEKISQEAKEGEMGGYFLATQAELKDAFDTVQSFSSANAPPTVCIRASKKYGVKFSTSVDEQRATSAIEAEKTVLVEGKPFVINVHGNYLGEFIKILPKTLPMRIEQWDSILRIEATNMENGSIEYVVAQADSDT